VEIIQKKDYNATVKTIQDNGQLPDAMTAFVDMDENNINEYGFNRDN